MFHYYRVIVFPATTDFMSSLPPQLNIPEDNIWEVFVTVVRCFFYSRRKKDLNIFIDIRSAKNIHVRLTGPHYSDLYENLMSDMDLHYFDAAEAG